MFDSVRNSKRIVQIILALIILPFAFWGVESYVQNVGVGVDLAKVGDIKITPTEFQQTLREQQDRLRATLGKDFDPAMLDTPQARQALLDSLVNQRLLGLQARGYSMLVSDQQLGETIIEMPALQVDGKFSRQRYEQLLRAQGLNEAVFESRLRQDLSLQQLTGAVGDGAIVSRAEVDRWVALQTEQREVSEVRLRPEDFSSRVKVTPEQVSAYYNANRAAFEIPESVRVEYVVLSSSQLRDLVTVGEDQLKEAFEARKEQFALPEERRASHILIQVPKDAPAEKQAEARTKASEILKAVRQSPDQFAKIARERSEDPGSASNGGDLGYFARGAMVKAFEDAAFGLKQNEISDLVQSEFGFHIIKLTEIKAAARRGFEDVRAELEAELRQQAAGRKFAEVAESFSNTVYEQPDSLKPAAEKFKLAITQTGWILKGKVPAVSQLSNEKVLSALFSDDAIKNRRNIEAVEIAPNTLLSARVIEHKPAQLKPLEEVGSDVEKRLVWEEAVKLARAEGQDKLARLLKGEDIGVTWGASRAVRRAGDPSMSVQAVREVFRLDGAKLPAYAGADLPDGGYGLYKLTAINRPEKPDPQIRAAVIQQLTRLAAEQDFTAYLGTLRERYPVSVNTAVLESR